VTNRPVLQIEVSSTDQGATVITCHGEIDAHNVSELSEAIGWSITSDLRQLRIDLTHVQFIESSGLACLLLASATCQEHGAKLELIPSQPAQRILELIQDPRDGSLPTPLHT
jgi:anti-anti-sigma factor